VRDAPTAAPARRRDIEGLRGLAVVLVVVYHVWVARVSGGVDAFFVLSGFLITAAVLSRLRSAGGLSLPRYWSRLLARLLPTAAVVLLGTLAATVLWVPPPRWSQVLQEIWASLLSVQNWLLAADSVDYLAARNTASPVQHFWSLSVQVQFYLVWPLLLVAGVALARRLGRSARAAAVGVGGLVLVSSFGYALLATAARPEPAYFDTGARLWEFAAGGLAFLAASRLARPSGRLRPLATAAGWAGVVGLVATGAVLDGAARFPGAAALLPVGSVVLVLLAGAATGAAGPGAVGWWLARRPLTWLGGLSYPLYLWHWPVLVVYLGVAGRDTASPHGGLVVVLVSVLLAVLTSAVLDRLPQALSSLAARRRTARARSGGAVAAVTALTLVPVLVAATGLGVYVDRQTRTTVEAGADPDFPGAGALDPFFDVGALPEDTFVPDLTAAGQDWPAWSERSCEQPTLPGMPQVCEISSGTTVSAPHVMMVGDSHADSWGTALAVIGQARGWRVTGVFAGACPLSTRPAVGEGHPRYDVCRDLLDALPRYLEQERPDVVLTVGTRDVRVDGPEQLPQDYLDRWAQVTDLGIPVVALRDNPRWPHSVPDCVARHGRWAAECSAPRAQLYDLDWAVAQQRLPEGVTLLDTADLFCDRDSCPPVVGNVLVYMDDNHVGRTYMATLAPRLDRLLVPHVAQVSGT